MNTWDVFSAIGSLLLIIGILILTYYATRWYARKMGATGSGKYIKILDRVGLGGASVVLVEVAGRYYLLGLGDKQVQLLGELEGFELPDIALSDQEASTNFGSLLRGILDKTAKGKGEGGD